MRDAGLPDLRHRFASPVSLQKELNNRARSADKKKFTRPLMRNTSLENGLALTRLDTCAIYIRLRSANACRRLSDVNKLGLNTKYLGLTNRDINCRNAGDKLIDNFILT